MKILLTGVNSKYIHSNPALYYLYEYSAEKAFEESHEQQAKVKASVEIVEYTINMERQQVLRDIFSKKPDVIAFSVYLWNVSFINRLMSDIHKVMPECEIWLGGPEVSFDAEKVRKDHPFLRGVIAGEGEKNFYKLVKAYIDGTADGLPEIMKQEEELDFDSVPFPYKDLNKFENRIIYYETSRGCPFKCAYCLSSVDRKVRLRNIDLVKKELKTFLDAKVQQVKFVDRTFNCNPEHTKAILEFIKENDNGVTNFHFEMAAELITDEEIAILNSLRKGLVQLEIGVQTTNAETLKLVNRKSDIGKLKEIVKRLREVRNMHIHLDLIAGLPKEDLASFKNSFNEVYGMKPDDLQLGFLKVLKGSPMENMVEEHGIVYSEEPPYEVLSTKYLSFEDITELKAVEEMLEVYHNSGQFENSITFLEKRFETPYELYKALADYYRDKGLDKLNHNRYERYSILKDFCDDEKLAECLLTDLYLRDNVKSRPAYGDNGVLEKERRRAFYEERKYEKYLPMAYYGDFTPVQVANMTHIEKTRNGCLLFDYSERDPLTYNAKVYVIDGEDI